MPLNSPTVKVVVVSIKSFPSEAISVSVKIGSKVEVSGNNVGKSFVVIRLLLVEVSCTSVVGIGSVTLSKLKLNNNMTEISFFSGLSVGSMDSMVKL